MDIKPLAQSHTLTYMSWVSTQTQSTLKRSPRNVKTFWLESHRQARSDFRARSGRACLWILLSIWFFSLTAGFVFLCIYSTWSNEYARPSACLPDDSFNLQPSTYRYWSNSGFFQITLGFGHLTFTQAKAIDVIWDIVVGRGGQGLLALLSWQTFVQYVTTSMEIRPVTFNTYRTIFLQNESLILAIPRIIRDFSRRRGLHSKFAMVFIVLTMLFVLIFPTLGSAMTGYSGNVEAYVPDIAGNNILFSSFRPLYYVIHDGNRVNLTDDYEVLASEEAGDPVIDSMFNWAQRAGYDLNTDCKNISNSDYYIDRCVSYERIYNVSAYVGKYRGLRNMASTFAGVDISPPLLNITSYYTSWGLDYDSYPTIPQLNYSTSLNATGPAVDQAYTRSWTASGEHFDQVSIEANGVCQATKDYQWGFSFIQLIIMMLLLWFWTLGTTILWTSSKLSMKQRGRDSVAGEYKAIFELADAMHAQLADMETEEGEENNARSLTESKLRQRIKKNLNGGAIAYDTTLLPEHDANDPWTLRAWAAREAWWLAALVASLIITAFSIRASTMDLRGDLFVFFALPLALGFAMYVGTTHSSRAMVLGWAVLGVCVAPALALAVVFAMYVRAA
ncbi:hypothetical protein M3J09_004810 [Ascochyta lentis]